jgi:hypothetical protein
MKKLILGLLAVLSIQATETSAREATVNDVIMFVRGGNQQWEGVMLGVSTGVEGASVYAERENGKALFCPPKSLAITHDQHVRILETFVEKNPKWGNASFQLLGWVYTNALADVFPCR